MDTKTFFQRRVYYKTGPAGPVRYGAHLDPWKTHLTEDQGRAEKSDRLLRVLADIEHSGGDLLGS